MIEIRPGQLDEQKLRQTLVLNNDVVGPAETPFRAQATARVDEFAEVRVGGRVDGYAIVDALAEGGMGAVFRVKDKTSDRDLALKAPLPDGRGGTFAHRMRRFLREVRLASRMDHAGVAKVVEVGQQDGLPYFTMELVDGTPLSERLYEGALPIGEALAIIESAARGVQHIHEKGVIQRDLKPQNILVKRSGEVVVIDFGLARDAAGIDPRITQSGVWLGTPAYISPEQAQGEASFCDARADVYSLAAVLYEALTGVPPYGSGNTKQIFKNLKTKNAEPIRTLRPECPEAVEAVVMKGIAKNRDSRFSSALELADAIAEARKSVASLPRLEVDTDPSVAVVDLDVLESNPVDRTSPILRSKDKKHESHRAAKRELTDATLADEGTPPGGWNGHGTSNAQRALPPEKKGTSTERRMRSVEGSPMSRRLEKDRDEQADRRARLLALGGPALLAAFGLLLLFL